MLNVKVSWRCGLWEGGFETVRVRAERWMAKRVHREWDRTVGAIYPLTQKCAMEHPRKSSIFLRSAKPSPGFNPGLGCLPNRYPVAIVWWLADMATPLWWLFERPACSNYRLLERRELCKKRSPDELGRWLWSYTTEHPLCCNEQREIRWLELRCLILHPMYDSRWNVCVCRDPWERCFHRAKPRSKTT